MAEELVEQSEPERAPAIPVWPRRRRDAADQHGSHAADAMRYMLTRGDADVPIRPDDLVRHRPSDQLMRVLSIQEGAVVCAPNRGGPYLFYSGTSDLERFAFHVGDVVTWSAPEPMTVVGITPDQGIITDRTPFEFNRFDLQLIGRPPAVGRLIPDAPIPGFSRTLVSVARMIALVRRKPPGCVAVMMYNDYSRALHVFDMVRAELRDPALIFRSAPLSIEIGESRILFKGLLEPILAAEVDELWTEGDGYAGTGKWAIDEASTYAPLLRSGLAGGGAGLAPLKSEGGFVSVDFSDPPSAVEYADLREAEIIRGLRALGWPQPLTEERRPSRVSLQWGLENNTVSLALYEDDRNLPDIQFSGAGMTDGNAEIGSQEPADIIAAISRFNFCLLPPAELTADQGRAADDRIGFVDFAEPAPPPDHPPPLPFPLLGDIGQAPLLEDDTAPSRRW